MAIATTDGGRESFHAALCHVWRGRKCLKMQSEIIENLHSHRLPAEQAEAVLAWLKDAQALLEEDYRKLLLSGPVRRSAERSSPSQLLKMR
jgi:hypothetical protein